MLQSCVGYSSNLPEEQVSSNMFKVEDRTKGKFFKETGFTNHGEQGYSKGHYKKILIQGNSPSTNGVRYVVSEYGNEWCGITLYVVIPIPLKLPVCNEYKKTWDYYDDGRYVQTITTVNEHLNSCGLNAIMATGGHDIGSKLCVAN